MKILIIEDEQPAAQELKRLLGLLDDDYQVMDVLASNEEIRHWAANNSWPDLIFSDIELLDGPVFSTYQKLNPTAPIIFTTAYEQYMANAFEANGIAYLLKPFNESQLSAAITKYHRLRPEVSNDAFDLLLKSFSDYSRGASFKTRYTIKKGNGIYILQVDEIACMKMQKGVLHFYDQRGGDHLMPMTLSDCFEQLDPLKFFQLNRSEGVALTHIERMESYGQDRLAVYVKGQEKPLISSVSRTPEFRKWLG